MKKILMALTAATSILASCSNDDADLYVNNDQNQLRVYGYIQDVKSRVSDNGTDWTVGDAIGVTGADATNIKYTTSSTTGNFTSATGITLMASNKAAEFSAYYPFAGAEGTSPGEIAFDVADASQNVDFLYAKASAADYAVGFAFDHKMSKITLTLAEKDGNVTIEENENITVAISGIPTTGKFNTVSGAISVDNAEGTITKTVAWASENNISFIVPSYASAAGLPVNVTIAVGGTNFVGSITPDMTAGNNYKYTITINTKANTLAISSATLNGWNDIVGEGIAADEEGNTTPTLPIKAKAAVGDFLLNNGKVLDKNFDLATIATYPDTDGLEVVGIVYYAENAATAQPILAQDCATATHGLALALGNANDVAVRFNNSVNFNYATQEGLDSYVLTDLNMSKVSTAILGYNNTAVMKYVFDNNATFNGPTEMNALTNLSAYQAAHVVTGTSDWYLPSYAEWTLIIDNYDVINSSMVKAGGSLTQYDEYETNVGANDYSHSEMFYWTSTLRGTANGWVTPAVEVSDAATTCYLARNSNNLKGFFRFAVAF